MERRYLVVPGIHSSDIHTWFNMDWVWAAALVVTGVLVLLQ